MNLKKGFLRLALVLSAIPAIAGFFLLLFSKGNRQAELALVIMGGGPVIVWAVYGIVYWIAKGFKDQP